MPKNTGIREAENKNPLYLHSYGQKKVKGHIVRLYHIAGSTVLSLCDKGYVHAL